MAKKIDAFTEAFDFDFSDIFHLRTTGGIDKKIKGENLRHDLGMIAPFPWKISPGWIWADGSTISNIADPEYAELIAKLKTEAGADAAHPYYHADADKAVLPDYRGAGIRGIDAAANRDKDGVRKSGDYQADENKIHVHYEGAHSHSFTRIESGSTYFSQLGGGTFKNSFQGDTTGSTNLGNTGSQGAAEGTVKNVASYILIRY